MSPATHASTCRLQLSSFTAAIQPRAMDGIPTQKKRLMMDPTEFWSSQFTRLRPSTPGPSAVNRRSGSVDLDDPLLSASPSQLNAPEKSDSRQQQLAVVLKSPAQSHQYSWSEGGGGNGRGSHGSGPSQQGASNLASRAKKETPVPLPRQIVRIPPLLPELRPTSTPRPMPTPAHLQSLSTKSFPPKVAAAATSSKPAPKPTLVPLPKQPTRPSVPAPTPTVNTAAIMTASKPTPPALPASSPTPTSQPSAGRGRPKGWKPGMSYTSLRGPAFGAKPVRQAKPKTLPLGPAKRRGRPPKAPSPLPWQVYLSLEKSFAAFLCEWGSCKAELHNLDTLRHHVLMVHCRRGPFVCRWGKCAGEVAAVVFSDERSLEKHIEQAHLIPFSWHVGDGPQNDGSRRQLPQEEEVPDYLKDEHGNQVTPSVRDQEVEDFVTWKSNRQKLKDLLVRMNENLPSEESDSLDDDG
ncbi:hypothetical protein ACQKWADRAFT_305316 [Trichoderma austrokoningii]